MKWFADNSELNGLKDAEIPDILMFGGIAVPTDVEHELRCQIEHVKKSYGHPRAPIKWNMRDLKSLYERQEQTNLYRALLDSSREWRRDIFSALAQFPVTVVVACIESYSASRTVIKRTREQLTGHCFSNALMRFALHVKEKSPDHAQVVLDWPDRGDPKPFDSEYRAAFNLGKTLDKGVTYQSGPLSALRFSDSVSYTTLPHSTLLQVADLVVGATRECVECCLGKKETGQGVDCAQIIRDRFRGAPDRMVGRGLSISSGNILFKNSVKCSFRTLLYPEPEPEIELQK